VTVTYSSEFDVADLVSVAQAEAAADWDNDWDVVPTTFFIGSGLVSTDLWEAPASFDDGDTVYADLTQVAAIGVRDELQPWLCIETKTDQSGPTDTVSNVMRAFKPTELIGVDDVVGASLVDQQLKNYDTVSPPACLLSIFADNQFDIGTEDSLGVGDYWSRAVRFVRTGRVIDTNSATINTSYTYVAP
jgi:hypothetical protein